MSCVGEPNKSLKSFYHSAGWNVILYLDVFFSSDSGSGFSVVDLTGDDFFLSFSDSSSQRSHHEPRHSHRAR